MGEKLKSPPLLEAICEFRFEDLKSWTSVVPGQLYEKIRDRFPKHGEVKITTFAVNPKMGEVLPLVTGAERTQMKTSDESAMVQVSHDLLAINQLKPYKSWESFRAVIQGILTTYLELIGPCKINRIGLRYINQIKLTESSHEIAEYMTVVPTLPMVSAENPLTTFFQRYEIAYKKLGGVMIHQTGVRRENGDNLLMLDMDFVRLDAVDSDDLASLWSWLDSAHNEIYKVFKGTLQPPVYKKMKEGKI